MATTEMLLGRIEAEWKVSGALDEHTVISLLKETVLEILSDTRCAEIRPERVNGLAKVVLFVGVNGVGKTTTLGKLAKRFSDDGARVLVAACDTFRAAAGEQLAIWAERAGAELVLSQSGEKPTTVAYRAMELAKSGAFDVLLIDTAGRLHTRTNLMNELGSVHAIIAREQPGAPHETILVLDASTGQNALQQARDFHEKTALSGIVVTKLDGTPKGGIVVAIKKELGVPIRYVGVGERIDDLLAFSAETFVEALFQDGESPESGDECGLSPSRHLPRRGGARTP